MPSKRQRRAAEELEALQDNEAVIAEDPKEETSDDGDEAPANAFAALEAEEKSESEEEEMTAVKTASKKRKNKKKPKKKAQGENETNVESSSTPSTTKTKQKPVKSANTTSDMDEIDAALAVLGVDPQQHYRAGSEAVAQASAASTLRNLLAADAKHLDADQELVRMFGSKVVNAARASESSSTANARSRDYTRMHSASRARNHLAKPKGAWPPIALVKSGLDMEPSQYLNCAGEPYYNFVHSISYKSFQATLLEAIVMSDVEAIYAILQQMPYHIDSLLQLSDVALQQGDAGQSDDFVERALYAFESTMSGGCSIINGTARLDFQKIENRPMWRALNRKVLSLTKRGCWRTAFETAKVMLQLDPFIDRYGALLHLEFLAPKAKQGDWLLKALDELPAIYISTASGAEEGPLLKLETYPGLAFAKALILFDQEEAKKVSHDESSAQLVDAILRFPYVIPELGEKLGIKVPEEFARNKRSALMLAFDIDRPDSFLHLLAHLYVYRSESLFKPPEILTWLQAAIKRATPLLDDASNPNSKFSMDAFEGKGLYGGTINSIPSGIGRHLIAADITVLRPMMPPGLLASVSNTYDILPPPDGTGYDQNYFGGVQRGRSATSNQEGSGEALEWLLRNGVPGQDDPPEVRQAFEARIARAAAEFGVPGAFPEEEQNGEAPAEEGSLMRLLRGIFGRGQAEAPAEGEE